MTEEKKDESKKEDAKETQGPSKMPDIKEMGAMAGKLFNDVKSSITEIIGDYKSKRPETPAAEQKAEDAPIADEKKEDPEASVESVATGKKKASDEQEEE